MTFSLDQIRASNDVDALKAVLTGTDVSMIDLMRQRAAAFVRLKALGEAPPLPPSQIEAYERIEAQQLSPEFVVWTAANPGVYRRGKHLTVDLQRRIAANDAFEVYERGGSFRAIKAQELTKDQFAQVFTLYRERTAAEQVTWLEEKATTATAKVQQPSALNFRRSTVFIYQPMEVPLCVLERWVEEIKMHRRKRSEKRRRTNDEAVAIG